MSRVKHPRELLPNPFSFDFLSVPPFFDPSEFAARINSAIEDYFDYSRLARWLWHYREEGLLTDDDWVFWTLKALKAEIKEKMAEEE